MRFKLAILVGRIIRKFGLKSNRSTNLPGNVAIRICPNFFSKIHFSGKVIAVTGSNGKTTTSNMIAFMLKEAGYRVINNVEGANLSGGIATTILSKCTLKGEMNYDYVVFEVDERFARIVFRQFSPDIMLVTNLVRDQVVRNGHPDIIMEKLGQGIAPSVQLVLNANDPISSELAPKNNTVYFGVERTEYATQTSENITHDCKVCPHCFHHLHYNFYHYNHLGDYVCENCNYKMKQADYYASEVDFSKGSFCVNGVALKTKYTTLFNMMNTTAAIATCVQAGLTLETACEMASRFEVSKERYDEFDFNGRKTVLMLTKQNSVSLDQSISFALLQPEQKTVLLYVNNVIYTENKDISWLYDVSFERLKDKVDHIVCGGSRAVDLAVRLKLANIDMQKVSVQTDVKKLKQAVSQTQGSIYILAASAFGNEDGVLSIFE